MVDDLIADAFGAVAYIAMAAARVAAVILKTVQVSRIAHEGSETGVVTISCVAAAFTGLQDLNNPFELVHRAYHALYMAKTEGWNRVRKFEPGMNTELHDPYGPPIEQNLKLPAMISPKVKTG